MNAHFTPYQACDQEPDPPGGRSRLLLMAFVLAMAPLILYLFTGAPHLPSPWPTWDDIAFALQGTYVPLEGIGYVLATAAWLLWAWLAVTVLLRVFAVSAELLTHGAAWARSLHALSDRLTLPIVRRIVDGALVATVVVQMAGRSVPVAAAASLAGPATASYVGFQACAVESELPGAPSVPADVVRPTLATTAAGDMAPPSVTHVVQPGETLWSISERYYSSGFDFHRIVAANAGRPMPDGQRFTRAGLIRPGWLLEIPLPNTTVEALDGERYYDVEVGDTLQGIAARILGNEGAWEPLFETNRGVARLADGRTLTDPDLIWPGLRLRLPTLHDGASTATGAGPSASSAESVEPCPGDAAMPAAPAAPVDAADQAMPAGSASASGDTAPVSDTPSGTAAGMEATPLLTTEDAPAAPPTATDEQPVRPIQPPAAPTTNGHTGQAALAAALAVIGAGGAAFLARRHSRYGRAAFRRSLDEPPAFAPVEGLDDAASDATGGTDDADLPDAEHERVFAHHLHGAAAEPVALGTAAALRFLAAHGVGPVAVVTALQGRTDTGLTLHLVVRTALEQQARIVALAPGLGECLGGQARAGITPDHDVSLSLTELRSLRLLAAGAQSAQSALGATDAGPGPLLVPVGALAAEHVLYANWRELGNVLVAGMPGGGTDVVLASLVTGLAARSSPAALHVVTISAGRGLPEALLGLPHQQGPAVHPADTERLSTLVHDLSWELMRRLRRARPDGSMPAGADADAAGPAPEIVLVVDEVADLQDSGALASLLDAIGTDGPRYGISLLTATTRLQAVPDAVLARFTSHIVLRLGDEDTSVRLLGSPDAVDLSGHGQLLLSVDRRAPVQLRGVRVAPDQLDLLVQSMRDAYAAPAGAAANAAAGAEPRAPGDGAAPAVDAPHGERDEHATTESGPTPGAAGNRGDRPGHAPAAPVESPFLSLGARADGDRTGDNGAAAAARRNGHTGPPLSDAVPPAPVTDAHETGGGAADEPGVGQPGEQEAARATLGTADHPAHVDEAAPGSPGDSQAPPTAVAHRGPVVAITAPATEPEAAPLLHMRCFGPRFAVSCGERELTSYAGGRNNTKPWEILAYLAAQPTGEINRGRLLALYWPDEDDETAGDRLNTHLMRVRKLLSEQVPELRGAVVRSNGRTDDTISFDTKVALSDVKQFVHLCNTAPRLPRPQRRAAYEEAHALYRGDLLCEAGYGWVYDREDGGLTLQERYRADCKALTKALAQLYLEDGEADRAAEFCKSVLRTEPLAEDLVQLLYRAYGVLGDLVALKREHRRLLQALRDANGGSGGSEVTDSTFSQPERATVRVYEEVLAALNGATREVHGPVRAHAA